MSVADKTDCQTSDDDVTGNSDMLQGDLLKTFTTKNTGEIFTETKGSSEYLENLVSDNKCAVHMPNNTQIIKTEEVQPYKAKEKFEEPMNINEDLKKKYIPTKVKVDEDTGEDFMTGPKVKKMKLSPFKGNDYDDDDDEEDNKHVAIVGEKWVVKVESKTHVGVTENDLRKLLSPCGYIRKIKRKHRRLFHVVFDCELAYHNALKLRSPTLREQPVYVDSVSHKCKFVTVHPVPQWDEVTLQEYLKEFFLHHDIIMSSVKIARSVMGSRFAKAFFADCKHWARAMELKTVQFNERSSELMCCGAWRMKFSCTPLCVRAYFWQLAKWRAERRKKHIQLHEMKRVVNILNGRNVRSQGTGRCLHIYFTLRTRKEWEAVLRKRTFGFKKMMFVDGLPEDVNYDELCKSVRQFYEQHGTLIIDISISPSSPPKMLVKFAGCPEYLAALKLGDICIDGLTLSVKCCKHDHGSD